MNKNEIRCLVFGLGIAYFALVAYFVLVAGPSLPDDVPSLIRLMGDNDINVHMGAANKLLAQGKGPFLIAVHDPDAQVRSVATHFLASFKNDPEVRTELVRLASDEDRFVRMWAAFSLGEVGTAAEVPTLEMLARDSNENVRDDAAEALEKISGKRAKVFRASP